MLVEFLHRVLSLVLIGGAQSPLYEQPVMDFLDDRCLIFDMEEENKLEYTEVGEWTQQ